MNSNNNICSSVVEGSPGFLCNNETLHTYRLNTFSVR